MRCPCDSGDVYDDCCGRLHRGAATAATAEALMRSRYSAFARGEWEYLLASWHPSTRPATLEPDRDLAWTRLEIVSARGGPFDQRGEVEFRAHYRSDTAGRGALAERSTFVRENGEWLYVSGVSS